MLDPAGPAQIASNAHAEEDGSVAAKMPPRARRATCVALLCIAAALLADVAAAASAQAAGPVVGWGNGGNGELGTGSQPIESDVPVAASLPAGVTVKSIAAG